MTDPTSRRLQSCALIAALLLGAAGAVVAQSPATSSVEQSSAPAASTQPAAKEEPLPSTSTLLERHVAALGGEAAIRRHRHVTWKGTFAMPGMGLEGSLLLQASAPNLFRIEIVAPGIGTIQQGYDGKVGWGDNPMTGPTLTQGGELEMMAVQSDFYIDLNLEQHYQKVEVVGRETFAAEPCYKVALTTASGITMFQYFSVASGLLVGAAGDLPTSMGDVFVETVIGGYREFDGRLYPTENRQKTMGAEQVLTLSEADFSEIDPAVFALPEAIRTLVGGQQAQ